MQDEHRDAERGEPPVDPWARWALGLVVVLGLGLVVVGGTLAQEGDGLGWPMVVGGLVLSLGVGIGAVRGGR